MLGSAVDAQNQSYVTGKIVAVGREGVSISSSDPARADARIDVPAGSQTQVRLNILTQPDRIIPGTYVEMRVLWNGEDRLRATSIKIPEGRPTMFGLYQG
jgi:hypothetical protein